MATIVFIFTDTKQQHALPTASSRKVRCSRVLLVLLLIHAVQLQFMLLLLLLKLGPEAGCRMECSVYCFLVMFRSYQTTGKCLLIEVVVYLAELAAGVDLVAFALDCAAPFLLFLLV